MGRTHSISLFEEYTFAIVEDDYDRDQHLGLYAWL
jgi:DNA-binding transcriptional MocR family regulator